MKKIMFSDKYGLTQAVLEGRKTQTRRIVSESLIDEYDNWLDDVMCIAVPAGTTYEKIEDFLIKRSKYSVGEIVAIAQSMCDVYAEYDMKYSGKDTKDLMKKFGGSACFNNKMFVKASEMPHQIRITNVRIERLQDISREDCLAEGIERMPDGSGFKPYAFYDTSIKVISKKDGVNYGWYISYDTPREAYASLIDKVSGKGTWDSNPYVFVYDFELIK